jgi:hypothetical protein
MKCKYHDDGHGNGSYISGSCCGPPTCSLSKKGITPTCEGIESKCNIPKTMKRVNIRNIKNKQKEPYYPSYAHKGDGW